MGGNNQNWGKKASCLGQFALAFFLFIILLIWLYTKNGTFLN
jgi:hypothetical protein